ncbi:MAG: AAA family ATPase, partial [Alistipes sp.]|nr:AAA family ATPase [Alistipes sp.]
MLRRLTVENYALIEHLELELDSHLNIITGETGAGKSILLGALGLLLGNKNDGSAMRDASESCVIEGLFDISKLELREFFEENELEYEDEISIRRVLTPSGKSRSFIGDMPAPLSVVKELGVMLLDIHSQHQNLILQSDKFRTEAIDTLAANAPLKSDYLISFTETNSLRGELQRLEQQMELERRDEEWLRHQVEELKSAKLKAGELGELEQEQALLANADRIGETIATLLNSLEEEQSGILVQLKSNIGSLNHIKELYPESAEWVERLQSIAIELKDINSSAAAAYEHVESDPERLQRVDDRMALIYSLCQKHRAATLDELIEIRDRYTARLEAIEHS